MVKRTLTLSDIIPNEDFCKERNNYAIQMREIKQHRRIQIGPDATFYFENYFTLWWQVQEMLRVEQGGETQMHDEISAYAPLVPQRHADGSMELVATFMIEIDDLARRFDVLHQVGGIESHMELHVGSSIIRAIPECDVERTNDDGKASAVHFVRFVLTPEHVRAFETESIVLMITHPYYTHHVAITDMQRYALACDFDDMPLCAA